MSYADFLVLGFVATSVMFSGMGGFQRRGRGTSAFGLFDRPGACRSPGCRSSTAPCQRNTALAAWGLVTAIAPSASLAVRVFGSTTVSVAAFAAFGLCVLYGFAFCWLVHASLGLFAGRARKRRRAWAFLVFPLERLSRAPTYRYRRCPGWRQAFANHQPMTLMADTVRILTGGHGAVMALGLHSPPPFRQSLVVVAL